MAMDKTHQRNYVASNTLHAIRKIIMDYSYNILSTPEAYDAIKDVIKDAEEDMEKIDS